MAAAQINCRVGDLEANTAAVLRGIEAARAAGADLVAFPELAITGYPPEDLLLKPGFVEENGACIDIVAEACDGIVAVVGFVDRDRDIYNAAAVLAGGRVAGVYHKMLLPNYGVFDEARYFERGSGIFRLYSIGDVRVGVSICEDAWAPDGPMTVMGYGGAEVIVNINASPYHRLRHIERHAMLTTRAQDVGAAIVYVNLVGGQDELVFDGQSVVYDAAGRLLGRARQFDEDLLVVDIDPVENVRLRVRSPRGPALEYNRLPDSDIAGPLPERASLAPRVEPALPEEAEVWSALVTGVADYVKKNGFRRVFIALSGGIDSSVVAAIAVDALGPDAVTGVSMPSAHSSEHSKDDAKRLAANLGIAYLELPIASPFDVLMDTLSAPFSGTEWGLAEENLQARIRGMLMMALSNKFGGIVLTTGNKSEMATGYCTLYGDMAGGYAVIKDVLKTLLYRIALWRNERAGQDLIPQSVLDKPPSAELSPGQLDTDSLPPYDVLDPILEAYVEDDRSVDEIVAAGHDAEIVDRIARLVDISEYKRRQSPPGVRITRKAFGKDRRLPITNGYHR